MCILSFDSSLYRVPAFQQLPEETLNKLADVLEEVWMNYI